MNAPLVLDPDPQSVGRARAWVVEELHGLGRSDLVDAAELGVSELVTNAILHAEPPITVRLLGSREQPRVEVGDNSKRPPRLRTNMTDEDQLLRTVGRGMGIVALYSRAWGADVSPDGKVVWFVPSGDPGVDIAEHGDVFDLDEAVERLGAEVSPSGSLLQVRLLGMPVQVFASFRAWYAEVRRELRLLAFAYPDDFPVAAEVADLALQVEHERRQAEGIERLDEAIRAGLASVDLDYRVPATAPETMARVGEAVRRADRFCREHRLLTVPATEQQLTMIDWYLGEFVRQGAGLEPIPYPGSTTVDPSSA